MKNIIKRIAAVALAGIAISACSDKEPNIDASRPIMLRTTGNETFLLTRRGKELDLSIYDGTKKFVSVSEKFPSPITGFDVYQNKLVYVSKTALDAPSTIYICENFFEECSKLSELKGAVQSPLLYEEGKRILFLYSDERNNKSNATYVNFDFYSFDITTARISRLTRYSFFPTSHIIAINENEFAFSAIFINKNRLEIENRKAKNYHSYKLNISENKIYDTKIKIPGSYDQLISFYYNNHRIIFEARGPGTYLYQTLVLSDGDFTGLKEEGLRGDSWTTPPEVQDGIVYFAEFDVGEKEPRLRTVTTKGQ